MSKWRPERRKSPCAECPFRKTSTRGWLGSDNPEHFIEMSSGGVDIPCHMDIDYSDKDWRTTQEPDAPLCVGSLQFQNNWFSLSRDPEVAKGQRELGQSPKVFETPEEFLVHHKVGKWAGPTAPGHRYRATEVDQKRGLLKMAKVERWGYDDDQHPDAPDLPEGIYIGYESEDGGAIISFAYEAPEGPRAVREVEWLTRWWDGRGHIHFRTVSREHFDQMRKVLGLIERDERGN